MLSAEIGWKHLTRRDQFDADCDGWIGDRSLDAIIHTAQKKTFSFPPTPLPQRIPMWQRIWIKHYHRYHKIAALVWFCNIGSSISWSKYQFRFTTKLLFHSSLQVKKITFILHFFNIDCLISIDNIHNILPYIVFKPGLGSQRIFHFWRIRQSGSVKVLKFTLFLLGISVTAQWNKLHCCEQLVLVPYPVLEIHRLQFERR